LTLATKLQYDVGRVLGMKYDEVDRISSCSQQLNIKLEQAIGRSRTESALRSRPEREGSLDSASPGGVCRNAGMHAAAW